MEEIDIIIAKSILGNLSKEEIIVLDEWRKKKRTNEEMVKDILEYSKDKKTRSIYTRPLFKDYILLKQEVQNSLSEEREKTNLNKKERISKFRFWYLSAAASVLMLLGSLFYFGMFKTSESKILREEEWVTKHTLSGQKLSLTLSDGSKIKLNSNAAITYPKSFKDSQVRHVHLEGEAFFEVAKMEKPFIVYSGNVETKVLGTSFNIKKESDNNVDIAVLTGKVNVQNEGSEVILLPGQLATVRGNSIAKTPFDEEEVIGWKDGILKLSGNDFNTIKNELEIWYGVKIEISGDIIEKGFNQTYDNAPLDRVLEGLSFIGNFDYEIKGKNIFLKVREKQMPMEN